MRHGKWKIAAGIGAAALIVGGVAGVAGLAAADPTAKSTTFVDGFGKITDDFNDHEREVGVLCDGCQNSTHTDLVTLWQSILASDGYLGLAEIDGVFGAATGKATAAWQADNELDKTGEVDQATWATADDYLELDDDGRTVTYVGDGDGRVDLDRHPDEGSYDFVAVTGPESDTYYNKGEENYIWNTDESIALVGDE